ncbi:lysine--tRNA ligase [Candidatus Woesearchaeota archaeon]|nr:lysine--tRNA ligase [Candidatus Woesearchaeota archaeon]
MEEQKDSFWADNIAKEVIERVENDSFLKKLVKKQGYIVYDEKTPSGTIHIGSGRGWIIHDAIAKTLRDNGVKANFILSSDDMDPLDKPSKVFSKKENDKYMGVPFRYLPSPVKGYKNYGDYYFSQCTALFDIFGIDAKLESTGERYEDGSFNKTIKIALDNAEKIQKIYAQFYGEDTSFANRLPFNVKCPKCGKIATTNASKWDKEKEEIYYECSDGVVEWAKGCGSKGWISPYSGNGKFPWKVEWAAKWPTKSVIVETAGKDHFTKNGSRTVACKISVDVFGYPPPYPSEGYNTGPGYEFFTVGGKKMSTSRGQGISFVDSINYAPAGMLRFLLIRTRPNAVIDFDPYRVNDMVLLYDRYDEAEKVYFKKLDLSEKENVKQKRIYELSHIGKIPSRIPPQVNLLHAAMLVQTFDDQNSMIVSLKKTGHIPQDVTKKELEYVTKRLEFAKKWVHEFAPETVKFELQSKVPSSLKLNEMEKKSLRILGEELAKKDYKEQELYNKIYDICKTVGIDNKDFFKGAYLALIGKEKGPKLAGFIVAVGRKRVASLLAQI